MNLELSRHNESLGKAQKYVISGIRFIREGLVMIMK